VPVLARGDSPALPVWLVVLVAVGLAGAVLRRSRRAAVATQALVLLVFIAETGIHSVHHIADPPGAASCQVLPVSQHLSGHLPIPAPVASRPAPVGVLVVAPARPAPAAVAVRPDLGRAPPVAG
jgi:hypothetical protein